MVGFVHVGDEKKHIDNDLILGQAQNLCRIVAEYEVEEIGSGLNLLFHLNN
ncbi:hypothetical protein [Bathymodiolus platifrons methanotrophic gill symbiont]|uniref:hypothetical protein n=1 Tax=Bathymodiolus platifrons methanotrophic gill symbiont TaxID=113268 RepID=UPI001C8D9EBB|nr:hypothetical protein [Bathymodiolus platifrons methanotrophic gill symbiont]